MLNIIKMLIWLSHEGDRAMAELDASRHYALNIINMLIWHAHEGNQPKAELDACDQE